MTAILCAAIALLGTPCERGGHAETIPPPRGGAAREVVLVRHLERFDAWVCIHEHEAAWNDPNPPFWGGLQEDWDFQHTYGADAIARHHGGLADTWTPAEQIVVAERAYRSGRGFGPWPSTGPACGFSTRRVPAEPWLRLPEPVAA